MIKCTPTSNSFRRVIIRFVFLKGMNRFSFLTKQSCGGKVDRLLIRLDIQIFIAFTFCIPSLKTKHHKLKVCK